MTNFIIAPNTQMGLEWLRNHGEKSRNWIVLADTNPVAVLNLKGVTEGRCLFLDSNRYVNLGLLEELISVAEQNGLEMETVF